MFIRTKDYNYDIAGLVEESEAKDWALLNWSATMTRWARSMTALERASPECTTSPSVSLRWKTWRPTSSWQREP